MGLRRSTKSSLDLCLGFCPDMRCETQDVIIQQSISNKIKQGKTLIQN